MSMREELHGARMLVVVDDSGLPDSTPSPTGGRRHHGHRTRRRMITPGQSSELLRCGDLVIDTGRRSCRLGNVELRLRLKQFDLLTRLAVSAGDAVSREDLMIDVWDRHWQGTTKTLDVHIAGLRQRLAEAGDELAAHGAGYRSVQIRTVHRVGYKLVCSDTTGPDATAGEQRR